MFFLSVHFMGISEKYIYDPLNLHTFSNIMCTQNQADIVQLARFVSIIIKVRYCYLHSV